MNNKKHLLIYKKAIFEDFLLRGDPTKKYGDNKSKNLKGFKFVDVFVCPHCIEKYKLYTECGVTKEEISCRIKGKDYQGVSFGNYLEEVSCGIKDCNNNNSYDTTLKTEESKLIEENIMTKEQRKQIVIKALKVNKEDAKRIIKHLTEQDCIEWIDEYTEDGKDNPLTDVHYENTFDNMIDWQYEDSKPSEMLGKPTVIEEYPEMLQLKDSVIFWYGLV